MFAAGVDVSNGWSTVSVWETKTKVTLKPFEVSHTPEGLGDLVQKLKGLDGETKVIMEHTGRYYESIAMFLDNAGLFVCTLNPLLIKQYQEGTNLRKVKTDKADAVKIAKFGLDNWDQLRQYEPMDTIRYQLKTLNRQFQLSTKEDTALTNNLIALLEQTYPGIRKQFDSPARPDGSQKWVDYVATFWHVDCVCNLTLNAFTKRYQAFCKKHGYNFSKDKADALYLHAKNSIALVPMTDLTKMMVAEAIAQRNAVSRAAETYRAEMNRLASQLPEYDTVMAMYGVGPSTGPQLMAEIGDIRRFQSKSSLVAFAGIDPGKDDSGDVVKKTNKSSKRGSPYLRHTLFMIMDVLIQKHPADEQVYQFLDRLRSKGKPYYVYMNAGGTKFLRIYYGKVRDCLKEKGLWDVTDKTSPETD